MSELKRLRLPQVADKVGLQKTAIYEKIKGGVFPKPKKDGKVSYWLSTDIDNWITNGTVDGHSDNSSI